MIDYLKLWIEDREQIETIMSLDFLQWREEHDPKTGEVLNSGVMVCDWGCFELKRFSSTRLKIGGSLHRYWEGLNYGQFPFSEINDAIRELCSNLRLNPMLALIKNLEVGFNVHPTIPASEMINDVICYKNLRPMRPYEMENEQVFFIEFASTDYYLKCYDKGRQFHTTNTLRFEIKYKHSRALFEAGARSLFDLTRDNVLYSLGKGCVDATQRLVFTDHTISTEGMSEKERLLFAELNNPNNWIYSKVKTTTDRRREIEFKRIISHFGGLKHNEQIRRLAGETLELLARS